MESKAHRALAALVCAGALAITVQAAHASSTGQQSQVASSCVFDHQTMVTTPGTCRPHAKTYPAHIVMAAQRAIYDSTLLFGVPYSILLRIARCESGLNPRAQNAGHFGLFQFVPATFHTAVQRMKAETGVRAHSFWNPRDSAYAAGYLFVTGYSFSWSCK